MEKRIELEKRGRPAEEIVELNLDNCRATQIDGLTDEFKNLECLSLINVGLTTLKGFPNLPNLKKLELSDNRISGSLNLLNGCPSLQYLNLSGNKIKDIETLEPLKEFQELRNLDLFNCEVMGLEKYRDKVFELLTSLLYLDGYDRENKEVDEDEEDEDGEVEEDGDEEDGEDDDEDDEDEDDLDDEDEEDDEDNEPGLEYLENDDLEDEEDGEDFDPEPEGDEDVDDIGEDEDEEVEGEDESRGVKRKLEEEDGEN